MPNILLFQFLECGDVTFFFVMYDEINKWVLECWSDKISNLKRSLWALEIVGISYNFLVFLKQTHRSIHHKKRQTTDQLIMTVMQPLKLLLCN